MTTTHIAKQVAQTCQWRGIPIAGIKANGPCNREATLTGSNNGGGDNHLCTQHMRQRARAGYGFQYVWPCTANGFVYYPATARAVGHQARALSTSARAMAR